MQASAFETRSFMCACATFPATAACPRRSGATGLVDDGDGDEPAAGLQWIVFSAQIMEFCTGEV